MKNKIGSLPIVEIRWIDSTGDDGGWTTNTAFEDWTEDVAAECISTGYLMKETEEWYILVSSYHADEVKSCLAIPKCCVNSCTVFE